MSLLNLSVVAKIDALKMNIFPHFTYVSVQTYIIKSYKGTKLWGDCHYLTFCTTTDN